VWGNLPWSIAGLLVSGACVGGRAAIDFAAATAGGCVVDPPPRSTNRRHVAEAIVAGRDDGPACIQVGPPQNTRRQNAVPMLKVALPEGPSRGMRRRAIAGGVAIKACWRSRNGRVAEVPQFQIAAPMGTGQWREGYCQAKK